MNTPKKTRVFNGETFTLSSSHIYKRVAQAEARDKEAQGYRTRVVQTWGKWLVYTRK